MNLVVDLGNTVLKAAVSDGTTLGKTYRYQGEKKIEYVVSIAREVYPSVLVLCSATKISDQHRAMLQSCAPKVILADPSDKTIFDSMGFPSFLPADMLCCIKAVRSMYGERACTIFDFGTTISSASFTADGTFTGSSISPGCTTRFRSLSRYARNLPLLSEDGQTGIVGDSLESSIRSGVVSGIMFEIQGFISLNPQNTVIFTGGDANYFAKRTKNSIFVICNLVLMGLAIIAQENEIEE